MFSFYDVFLFIFKLLIGIPPPTPRNPTVGIFNISVGFISSYSCDLELEHSLSGHVIFTFM